MSSTVPKTRLYEDIISRLIGMIADGRLKPGDRLPAERKLAEQLGVSRTAIREALRSMETLGYIRSRVGGGTYIKDITLGNIIDPFTSVLSQKKKLISELIEVRQLLEGQIAVLAAQRMTPDKAGRLRGVLDDMEKDIAAGGNGLQGDNAFHEELAAAAENSAMSLILNMCRELLSQSREATLNIPGEPAMALNDHRRILAATEAGDAEAAQAAMIRHLVDAQANLEKSRMD